MKKLIINICILTFAVIAACLLYRVLIGNTYIDYMPVLGGYNKDDLHLGGPSEGFSYEILSKNDKYLTIAVKPDGPGEADLFLYEKDADPVYEAAYFFGKDKTVYNRANGGFTGDNALLVALTFYMLALGFMLMRYTLKLRGSAFYAYFTIYTAGFSIFSLAGGVDLLLVTVQRLLNPATHTMMQVYASIAGMSYTFVFLLTPFLMVFSVAMAISNVALLRHERKRIQNVLGILISAMLIIGELVVILVRFQDFSGSYEELRIRMTAVNVLTTAFAYFECMLLGSIICGLRSVKMKPTGPADYLVILGCAFRKDGTLTPLLKGRVDRAVAFNEVQKAAGGKEAVYVPSGGQGPDESMPEAEAMSRYLRSIGISEAQILKEDKSRNTYQNMLFSGKLIKERSEGARVVYSTTNYHVFRSGVWANLAGLRAEGIGSKTKWWFWPNALMRECVGLLVNRWKQELVFLAVLTGFFAILTMLLGY